LFNTEPDKGHTPVMVLDAVSLKQLGVIDVPTGKAEGAAADGKGRFYLAGQTEGKIFVLDAANLKLIDTWSSPNCGKPTMIEVDATAKRLFVSCRSQKDVKAALVVLDTDTGKTIWSTEIGDGSDGLAYDAPTKRLFSTNGVAATMTVAEMTTPDSFKVIETLNTLPNLKVIAMDHANQKIYSMVAEGSADQAKKINLAVSPFNANTIFPNTFRVITFSK
jgi:outer membrane protein assembly factor BamB